VTLKLSNYYFDWMAKSSKGSWKFDLFLKEEGWRFKLEDLQRDTTQWSTEARITLEDYIKWRQNQELIKYWTEE